MQVSKSIQSDNVSEADATRTVSSEAKHSLTRQYTNTNQFRDTSRLRILAVLNAGWVALASTWNSQPTGWNSNSFAERSLHNYWILFECFLLAAALYCIAIMAGQVFKRFGFWLGVVLLAGYPAIDMLDRLSQTSLHTRLMSADTIRSLSDFLPYLRDFTTIGTFSKMMGMALGFVAMQVVMYHAASRAASTIADTTNKDSSPWSRWRFTFGVFIAIALLFVAMKNPTHVATVYRQDLRQHPLRLTGLVDLLMPPMTLFDKKEETQFEEMMLQVGSNLARLQDDYESLRVTPTNADAPDIVIIMAESLRFDAIALPQAPNLVAFQKNSLVGNRHFSGGNATQYGLFCLLSGLDSSFLETSRHWPMALPRTLKQAGYFTAFLGSGPFGWMSMTDFLRPEDWDVYRDDFVNEPIFYKRDQSFAEYAGQLLDRKREAAGHDGPVCVVMLPYTTHWDYHFDVDDVIGKPLTKKDLPWPPRPRYDQSALSDRYRSSIHAFDRIHGPLLRDDRLVVVIGDHGEAMFDYNDQLVHANSLSEAQFQTPFLLHVPGERSGVIEQVTHHTDVLPTVLDAIGCRWIGSRPIHGVSLLDKEVGSRFFMVTNSVDRKSGLIAPFATEHSPLELVQARIDVFGPRFETATVHDESGRFKQTLGANRDDYRHAFARWLEVVARGELNHQKSNTENLKAGLQSPIHSHRLYALHSIEQFPNIPNHLVPWIHRCIQDANDEVADAAETLLSSIQMNQSKEH